MRTDGGGESAWGAWPWRRSATAGAWVTALLAALSLPGDRPFFEGLAAAGSNGLVAFFLVGGLALATDGVERRGLAAGVAAATVGAVLPLRLAAVRLGAEGPFGGVADTTLDALARGGVVFGVVALAARWARTEGW
jgi:hypothetical protein